MTNLAGFPKTSIGKPRHYSFSYEEKKSQLALKYLWNLQEPETNLLSSLIKRKCTLSEFVEKVEPDRHPFKDYLLGKNVGSGAHDKLFEVVYLGTTSTHLQTLRMEGSEKNYKRVLLLSFRVLRKLSNTNTHFVLVKLLTTEDEVTLAEQLEKMKGLT